MIDVRELRLGNWVSNGVINFKLDTSSFQDCLNEAQVNEGMIEIKPIPLPHELLEKAGFIETRLGENKCFVLGFLRPDSDEIKHDIILVDFQEVKPEIQGQYAVAIKEYDRNIQFAITYIKHLHQLQNLFFALTGEELTITL